MPYIKIKDRQFLNETNSTANNPGELNYLISDELQCYIHKHGLSYKTINDVIGALEGAKLEFYRRVAAPYEDKKIQENGDIY